jgi:predicted ATPase
MIQTLELKNFKSFLDQKFDFKQLTIFAGINASGKSSITEALDFLHSDCCNKKDDLDNRLFCLDNLKSKLTRDSYYKISALWNNKKYSTEINLTDDIPAIGLNNEDLTPADLQILAASRIGSQEYYPLQPLSKSPFLDRNGIFIFDYILKIDDKHEKIPDILKYDDSVSFKDNLNDWLQIISPNSNLSIDITKDRRKAKPYYNGIEAEETGFGISYSLPIIAALLDTSIKTLVIDSPEAHLHPKGQAELCKLIAKAVSSGKQVILETHSDHIIDGIRIAVKNKDISNKDTNIFFLERDVDSPTKVTEITIDSYGNLSDWPESFFDQGLIDAGELL